MSAKPSQIKVNWTRPWTTEHQRQIIEAQERLVLVLGSVKSAKTTGAVIKSIETLLSGKSVNWVSSTHKRTTEAFEMITDSLGALVSRNIVKPNKSESRIVIPGLRSQWVGYSGEKPDTIFGARAHLGVLDEATRSDEKALWALRSTVAATEGQVLALANSDRTSHNYFISLCLKAMAGELPDTRYISITCHDTPFISEKEIEMARALYPDRLFRSLYLNEIMTSDSAVFGDLTYLFAGDFVTQVPHGHEYQIGYDVGRHHDASVVFVYDLVAHRIVAYLPMRQFPFAVQVEKVAALSKKYKGAKVVVDSTGAGNPVYEMLRAAGVSVVPFIFSNTSKGNLIENLINMTEKRAFTCPEIEQLRMEMRAFEYSETRAGNLVYGAPAGLFDDHVIALALSVWGTDRPTLTAKTFTYSAKLTEFGSGGPSF